MNNSLVANVYLPLSFAAMNASTVSEAQHYVALWQTLQAPASGYYYPDGTWVGAHQAARQQQRYKVKPEVRRAGKPKTMDHATRVTKIIQANIAKTDLEQLKGQVDSVATYPVKSATQAISSFYDLIGPNQFFCKKKMRKRTKAVTERYIRTETADDDNFKIMVVGECHYTPEDRMKIIAQFAKPGDIILMEGFPAGQTFDCKAIYPRSIEGQAIDYCLPEGVVCQGWDVKCPPEKDKVGEEIAALSAKFKTLARQINHDAVLIADYEALNLNGGLYKHELETFNMLIIKNIADREEYKKLDQQLRTLGQKYDNFVVRGRNRALMQNIIQAEQKNPNQRIFVVAGASHVGSHPKELMYSQELHDFLAVRKHIIYKLDNQQASQECRASY